MTSLRKMSQRCLSTAPKNFHGQKCHPRMMPHTSHAARKPMGNFRLVFSLTFLCICMVAEQTAVNTKMGKNLVGAFHQPTVVFMDMGFRKSNLIPKLSTREHTRHANNMHTRPAPKKQITTRYRHCNSHFLKFSCHVSCHGCNTHTHAHAHTKHTTLTTRSVAFQREIQCVRRGSSALQHSFLNVSCHILCHA